MKSLPEYIHTHIETLEYKGKTYSLYLKGIDKKITITIRKSTNENLKYIYEVSHAIHTPEQASPYRSSVYGDDTEEDCLEKAINDFTVHYKTAISKGHTPNAEWLVPY